MRDIAKEQAKRLCNRHGYEKAATLASSKAFGAMTDEQQRLWEDTMSRIEELKEK